MKKKAKVSKPKAKAPPTPISARINERLARSAAHRKNAAAIRSKPILSIFGIEIYLGDL